MSMDLIYGINSKPLKIEVMEQSKRDVMPIPDTYALRSQGQLVSNKVSHARKITTKSNEDSDPKLWDFGKIN